MGVGMTLENKKIAFIILFVLIVVLVLVGIAVGIYFAVATVKTSGRVTDSVTGAGMSGVSVSDGKNVVATDGSGYYELKGWHKSKFIIVTTPTGYWTEDYFIRLGKAGDDYNFALDKQDGNQENHSFLQITDTEIGADSVSDSRWLNELKTVAEDTDPAFIMHTGDICYEDGLNQHIKDMNTETMGVPVRYTIGNHDYVSYGSYGEQLFEELYGPVWYSFDVGDIHYVVTPIGHGDARNRYLKSDAWRWLANDLKNVSPDKKVVIFNHDSCPDENGFEVKYGLNTLDLREEGLIAWVYGHYHINSVNDIDGILNITNASPRSGGIDSSPSAIRSVTLEGNEIANTNLHYMFFKNGESEDGANWQSQLSGRVLYAEPIVVGDKVVIATLDDSFPRKPTVTCLDVSTGDKIWESITNNSVRNSMAIADGRVYAQDVEGFMHCYNLESGELIWDEDLGLEYPRNAGNGITYQDGVVFGGSSRKIVAMDALTGEEIWINNYKKGESSPFKMTIHGDKLLVGAHWNSLIAINIKTGKTEWKLKEKGFTYTVATPYFYDNKLIVASGSRLAEINMDNGKIIKRTEIEGYSFDTGSTPAYVDGVLYYSTDRAGIVAISRDTLEVQWSYKTRTSLIYTSPYSSGEISTVESSIMVKGDNLIFGASDGYLYVVERISGKLLSEFNIGSPICNSVAFYEGNIIVADFSGKVTSISYNDGILGSKGK